MRLSRLILHTVSIIIFVSISNAEILFEDNFDSTPDWQSAQEPNKLCSTGLDITWWAGACTTNCPPKTAYSGDGDGMYDAAYFSSDSDCTSVANQLYVIQSGYGKSGTKGLRWKLQGDGYDAWRGGRIGLLFPSSAEVHLGFWAKFQEGFSFSPNGHGQIKFIDIASYPPNRAANASPNLLTRFSSGVVQPICTYMLWSNRSTDTQYQGRFRISTRMAPVYDAAYTYDVTDGTAWPSDGDWHFYEMRVKLNSAPGVTDGESQLWIDGVSKYSVSNLPYVESNPWQSGKSYLTTPTGPNFSYIVPGTAMKGFLPVSAHTSGGSEPDWDSAVNIGDVVSDGNGNQWTLITDFKFNNSFLFDNHYLSFDDGYVDQFAYIDGLVVSTSYIGPSYVIRGKTLRLSPGQARKASGTGRFIQ